MSPKMKLRWDILGFHTGFDNKDSGDMGIWESAYLRDYLEYIMQISHGSCPELIRSKIKKIISVRKNIYTSN